MRKFTCLLTFLAVTLSSCSGLQEPAQTTQPTIGGDRISTATEVGEDGFDMKLRSVQISAPAGVAAAGTRVSVSTSPEPAPSDVDRFSSAVGEPVRVVLGDGQQPHQPVTIVFDLAGTELAAGVSPESPLAVLSRSDESGGVQAMPATWDSRAQTLTVVTDHLSWFWPFRFDVSKLFQPMIDTWNQMLGVRYPTPDCFGKSITVSSTTYAVEAVPGEVVWPCLTYTGDQILLELRSNSPLPWRARTDPSVPGTVPNTMSKSGLFVAAIYRQLYAHFANKESVVVPGGSTSFRFNSTNPPAVVSVQADVGLYLVATAFWEFETVFELFDVPLSDLLKHADTVECLAGLLDKDVQTDVKGYIQNLLSSTFTCLQVAVDDMAEGIFKEKIAFVLSVLGSGVGLVVAGIQGAVAELLGTNTASFSITRTTVAPPTPTAIAATVPPVIPSLGDGTTPALYTGVWEGTGFQYNNQHRWSIRMTLNAGDVGSVSGTIEYPSLQCGGELTLLRVTDTFIELREDITYGANCVDNGTIVMRLTDEKTADWKWSFADGPEGAESTLTKTISSQSQPTEDEFIDRQSYLGIELPLREGWGHEQIDGVDLFYVTGCNSGLGECPELRVMGPDVMLHQEQTWMNDPDRVPRCSADYPQDRGASTYGPIVRKGDRIVAGVPVAYYEAELCAPGFQREIIRFWKPENPNVLIATYAIPGVYEMQGVDEALAVAKWLHMLPTIEPTPTSVQDFMQITQGLVQSYYDAINARDYQKAHNLLGTAWQA